LRGKESDACGEDISKSKRITKRIAMTPDALCQYFTDDVGTYRFARWGRPIAPVVFGVEDATLGVVKGAIEAMATLAGHKMAETDPELGANLLVFFLRDWEELTQLPQLGQMIPDLDAVVTRLQAADAGQYRAFRFDEAGAIQACFTFVRVGGAQAELPAADIALDLAARAMLTWARGVDIVTRGPGGAAVLCPQTAALIRAAYDPVMPVAATDPAHALRLFARINLPAKDAP